MQFDASPQEATLVKRYRRFLADVRFPSRYRTTVHCPNTGRMTGCAEPGIGAAWLPDTLLCRLSGHATESIHAV